MADTNVLPPEVIEPLVNYLSSILPPPVFSVLRTFVSYSLALASSLFNLAINLASSHPSKWDAQTILPPIITLFAAYLALLSFYRTATWMIRTTFAMLKWGLILGALGAGAGYFLATANVDDDGDRAAALFGGTGLVSSLGALLLGMMNGEGQNAAGARKGSTGSRRGSQQSSRSQSRPKAWDSWDTHRKAQSADVKENAGGDRDVQKVIEQVLGAGEKTMAMAGWWRTVKSAAEGYSQRLQPDGQVSSIESQKKDASSNTKKTRHPQ